LPSQRSIRVPISSAWKLPTAKQFVVLVHAMLSSWLSQCDLLGLDTIDQALPFQRSISVVAPPEEPPAKQRETLGPPPPDNRLPEPARCGLATRTQPDGVDRSMSGSVLPSAIVYRPTPKHTASEHDTASSALSDGRDTATFWTDQPFPFH